jgi:hypothetical protein
MIPSHIRCESGLFVGVDRFTNMPRDRRLSAPGQDAVRLADYFSRAHANGTWRVLKGTARSAPNFITVLKAIHDLIAQVEPGRAGLFYFAGHAEVSENGLVLKTADSHPRFPNDTGLRLSRVLRLFKEARDRYFLLILDCCRSGLSEAEADDIPPNCCVLYACQHGDVTLETAADGIFTRSLIDTISIYMQRESGRECPLEFIVSNLHRQIFSWRPLGALSYEICGNLVDRLMLPLPDARQPVAWDIDLNLIVRYRFGDRQAFQSAFVSVVKLLAAWHSLSLHSRAAKDYIDEQLHYERGALEGGDDATSELFLDVKVPLSSSFRKPSSFLANILENVRVDDPETIAIHWPHQVKPSIFQMLRHTLPNGEWSQSQAGGYGLRWRTAHNGACFRGIAWVDNAEESTKVVMACETLDAVPVPMKFLLPGMMDLVDLMLAIRS